jgi:hypothetical protein
VSASVKATAGAAVVVDAMAMPRETFAHQGVEDGAQLFYSSLRPLMHCLLFVIRAYQGSSVRR